MSGGTDEERVSDLTFKARALAQAHPLSVAAARYRQGMIDTERATQPLPEFADWAATALLVGYCVRRVEEADVGAIPPDGGLPDDGSDATPSSQGPIADDVDLDELGRRAVSLSESIRQGRAAEAELLPPPMVEALLNRVISTEIDKRADHWKANIPAADWAQFEQYAAWWVIHGYALRAAETADLPQPRS